MLTVIYVSPSEKTAERIRLKLIEEGFLVKVRQNSLQQYELLVPQGELDEIREVLAEILP